MNPESSIERAVVIVAGGKGLRMGAAVRKQYLALDGVPILVRTVDLFLAFPGVDRVVLVAPEEDLETIAADLLKGLPGAERVVLTAGGAERQASVMNGLKALGEDFKGVVAVHDGVRPFVTHGEIAHCFEAAEMHGSAILATPAWETMKRVDGDEISGTLDRKGVWMAQTPQAFRMEILMKAHEKALEQGFFGTDDASLVEWVGGRVKVVACSRFNIKITTPQDLDLAQGYLSRFPLRCHGGCSPS